MKMLYILKAWIIYLISGLKVFSSKFNFNKNYGLIILILFNLIFFSFESNQNHSIVYIYAGPGVSKTSLKQTESTLNELLKSNYVIKQILPEQLINEDWEEHTALLIFPGGADTFYRNELNGKGNQKIKKYVENGGSYLGICAGGYYGGNFVEFAKGSFLEVLGERELSFFPGVVRGPILAPYNYNNESGARAAKITWKNSNTSKESDCLVYYNGGGFFVDAYKKVNCNIIATYNTKEEEAAIIECKVGQGKVILSGVHFEYDPNMMDLNDPYLKEIIPNLKRENFERIKLINYLIELLNLRLDRKGESKF